ncbi:unnamed protein product [Linum tenue]|uniref:beta-ketoacyl-[acyl-carrier-protein] synthase I n=1 Tax=Linum tenue TaxID=586396 RepID=A0AAV0PXL7_9ROSI|nr:unnamed protein product [Linum tenue]
MGLVSVFGNDVDAYYDKLLAGESGITLIDRFDASKFPTRFAGQIRGFNSQGYIDGKNDRRLDDCLRYCIGIELGFMGPNYSISTACATSNYCFYAAANHIRRGEADLMIAGGTEAAIIPIGLGGFVACRALSQRSAQIMESLEHAMKRGAPIIAEYLGGAINCDAYHMTDPRADGLGVSTCIERSLEDAGVSPEEVTSCSSHLSLNVNISMVIKDINDSLLGLHLVLFSFVGFFRILWVCIGKWLLAMVPSFAIVSNLRQWTIFFMYF